MKVYPSKNRGEKHVNKECAPKVSVELVEVGDRHRVHIPGRVNGGCQEKGMRKRKMPLLLHEGHLTYKLQ
jgi:hypothetical protein